MNMHRNHCGWLLAVPLWVGCSSPSKHVVLESRTTPPMAVDLTSSHWRLPVGIAIGINTVPKEGNDAMDNDTSVELSSSNPSVIGVDRTLDRRVFVAYGVSPGSATVHAKIDGEPVQEIRVQVDAQ